MRHWHKVPVLITGGLGMIGSTIAGRLVQEGALVTVLDALHPLYGGNLFNVGPFSDHIELLVADIRDEAAVRFAVRNKEVIFNLAAQVSYVDSVTEPMLDLDINCRGHLLLLEACRKQDLTPRIVFSSSRMVYGRTLSNPVDELHRTDPLMPYAIHKLAGEKYHLMYHANHGVGSVVARIANPYGPRQQMKHNKYGIVNWFMRLAMEGEAIEVFGNGDQVRDYVFVEDIADAMIALADTSGIEGEVFNLGSGQGTTFREMVRLVIEVVGRGHVKEVPWPADYANVETGDYVSDLTKVQTCTGWRPKVSLRRGMEATYDYYTRHQHEYW